jgi:hypothetical protein
MYVMAKLWTQCWAIDNVNKKNHICHKSVKDCLKETDLEPILRLLNLQLQRWRRLERFFKVEENTFVFKMH